MGKSHVLKLPVMCAAFAASAVVFPAVGVVAQEGDASVHEVVNNDTFTLTAPSGWGLVTGGLGGEEIARLPGRIRDKYMARPSDAVFVDPDTSETGGFRNTISVATLNDYIEIDDDVAREIDSVLRRQYVNTFGTFDLIESGRREMLGRDVYYVKVSYELLDYGVTMEQYVIPVRSSSVAVTCTYSSSTPSRGTVCSKTVGTMVLK